MASLTTVSIRIKKIFIPVILTLFTIGNDVCDGYQMEDYCNKQISFITESVDQIELELNDINLYGWQIEEMPYRKHYYCETKIGAWYSTYPKLMFYIKDLSLSCGKGHLEFYDDETGISRVSGLGSNICGFTAPGEVYTVDSRYFRIRYVPKRKQHLTRIFTIIITAFADDTCPSYDHECKNSRCINKDLACNGYDSCGDDSGCDHLSTGNIIGIVIGSLFGLAVIVTVIVCCIQCGRGYGQTPEMGTGRTPVTYTSSSQQRLPQARDDVNRAAVNAAYQPQEWSSSTNQPIYYVPTNLAQEQVDSNFETGAPPAYEDLFGPPNQEATYQQQKDITGHYN